MGNIGISSGAFRGQSTIVSAFFSSNCSFVGENAFKDCINLTQINNNNVIEEIGSSAFMSTGLQSATFSYLTSMGVDAFKECHNLSYINIPNCDYIASGTFENCTSLSSIRIPAFDMFTIHKNAFRSCTNLKSVIFSGDKTSIKINNNAFENCVKLSDIDLNNCTEIGSSAFYGCTGISRISLSCNSIPYHAFFGCTDLKKVYLNKRDDICNLEDVNAFYMIGTNEDIANDNTLFFVPINLYESYISNDKWVVYKDNIIKMIQDNQILYITSDNAQVTPENSNNDKYTNNYSDGYGLIEFKETEVLEELCDQIFRDAEKLKSVELPSKLKKIGDYEFYGCTNLYDINIFTQNDNKLETEITYIGDYAFENCKSLISFTIPQSVESLGEGIFAGCVDIENLSGKFVTSDKLSVVYGNKLICVLPEDNRRKINISDDIDGGIEILGAKCFYGCESLRRVDISESITQIGDNAFESCINLREVHFHGDLPTIGYRIFGDANTIRKDFKIFIPENKIEEYYNNGKGNLGYYKEYIYPMPKEYSLIYYSKTDNNITLPNTTTTHKNNPFTNDTYYYVTSENKLTSINSGYFNDDKNITDIILGEKIKHIYESAFSECTNLKYIYLSDDIQSLNSECFFGCESLTSIYIPLNCSFGNSIFYKCNNLKEFNTYNKKYISEDGRCYITTSNRVKTLQLFASGQLSNEEKYYAIPIGITNINASAFRGASIKSITLSEGKTTKIGDYAFSDCTQLEQIHNLNRVKTIGNYAFKNCPLLGTIDVPNVTYIGEYAFNGCKKMNTINYNILNKVTTIGDGAFKNCENFMNSVGENLNDRTLNLKTITYIGNEVFSGCSSLTTVEINDNISSIGMSAFNGCTSLTTASISENSTLSTIGDRAFNGCTSLNSFNLSNAKNLLYIGEYAFNGCAEYKDSINLPPKISSIGANCFSNSGISSLYIGDKSSLNFTKIPICAFQNCTNLERVWIHSSNIKKIGSNAFSGCERLISVVISSPIETFEEKAFENCSSLSNIHHIGVLKPVDRPQLKLNIENNVVGDIVVSLFNTLPDSTQTIGDRAFYGCTELKDITLPINLQYLGDDCFANEGNTSLTVSIPMDLTSPPKFKSPITSSPFGSPRTSLKIYLYSQYYIDVYQRDGYWDKYYNCMSILNNIKERT